MLLIQCKRLWIQVPETCLTTLLSSSPFSCRFAIVLLPIQDKQLASHNDLTQGIFKFRVPPPSLQYHQLRKTPSETIYSATTSAVCIQTAGNPIHFSSRWYSHFLIPRFVPKALQWVIYSAITEGPTFPSTLRQELCRLQGTLQTLTEHIFFFLHSWPYILTERSVYFGVRALPKQPGLQLLWVQKGPPCAITRQPTTLI